MVKSIYKETKISFLQITDIVKPIMDSFTQEISNMMLSISQRMDTLEGRVTLVEVNHQKHLMNWYVIVRFPLSNKKGAACSNERNNLLWLDVFSRCFTVF